jgi:hypothetical protein
MPPQRQRQQPLTIRLSWFTARRRWATLCREADHYDCRRLEAFRRQLRLHKIPYWGPTRRVFMRGHYSGSYFPASLRQLLALDYVPQRVQVPIPTDHFPHKCRLCPDTNGVQPPFHYVPREQWARGRPQREEARRHAVNNYTLSNDSSWLGRENGYTGPSLEEFTSNNDE